MVSLCLASSQLSWVYWHGHRLHRTHMESLHGILATGRLLPSSPNLPGTRSSGARPGVYLHKHENRHLAEGYATLTGYGTRLIFLQPCLERRYDQEGSRKQDQKRIKRFKATIRCQQGQFEFGDHLRDWSPELDLPLSSPLKLSLARRPSCLATRHRGRAKGSGKRDPFICKAPERPKPSPPTERKPQNLT